MVDFFTVPVPLAAAQAVARRSRARSVLIMTLPTLRGKQTLAIKNRSLLRGTRRIIARGVDVHLSCQKDMGHSLPKNMGHSLLFSHFTL